MFIMGKNTWLCKLSHLLPVSQEIIICSLNIFKQQWFYLFLHTWSNNLLRWRVQDFLGIWRTVIFKTLLKYITLTLKVDILLFGEINTYKDPHWGTWQRTLIKTILEMHHTSLLKHLNMPCTNSTWMQNMQ